MMSVAQRVTSSDQRMKGVAQRVTSVVHPVTSIAQKVMLMSAIQGGDLMCGVHRELVKYLLNDVHLKYIYCIFKYTYKLILLVFSIVGKIFS
jgi:hypothetical protein